MPSLSPITPSIAHTKGVQLSVSIPAGAVDEYEEQTKKVGGSLQESWEKARENFRKVTGQDLGASDYRSTKTGMLSKIEKQYGSDSKEAKKRDEILGTVTTIFKGIEIVAATAGKVAEMVFTGPTQMCFNAFDILLSIPKGIKKFHDDISALFKEICDYMSNFKVFDSIDRRGMLDPALLTSNNDILIALVDMILLIYKAIHNPIKSLLGSVILKNNAVESALGNLQALVAKQNQLTNTITLDSVLKSQSLSHQILQRTARIEDTGKDTNLIVRSLAADNTESKNLKVDKDRILKIDGSLDLTEDMITGPLNELKSMQTSLFEDTRNHYKNYEALKHWRESADCKKILYISGETSSGKTFVLSALAYEIENLKKEISIQQADLPKETRSATERSIYLTYYSFDKIEQKKDRGQFDTPAHNALKIMAAQLARQSTRYARELSEGIETLYGGQQSLQELWEGLKFKVFSAPANSTLYMLFDGLDQLGPSLQDLGKVLEGAINPRKARQSQTSHLEMRIATTGTIGTWQKLDSDNVSLVGVSILNTPLIQTYVENQLRNLDLFQDIDEMSNHRKTRVLDAIQDFSDGSFGSAKQKIKMIEEAVEEDKDFELLMRDLRSAAYSTEADEGLEILERLNVSTDISMGHKAQLREILMWTIYGAMNPEFELLEAALYLQHGKKSLEPLKRKIETRFDEALSVNFFSGVRAQFPVRQAIVSLAAGRLTSNDDSKESPGVRVNLLTDDLSKPSIQPLITDLRNRLAGIKYELFSREDQNEVSSNLIFEDIEASSTIIVRMLRALNDDTVRQQVGPLIEYSTSYLPSQLDTCRAHGMERVPPATLRTIGSGLVNFLWDSEAIASAWNKYEFSMEWLSARNVEVMSDVLTQDRLQDLLDPVQRRWVNKHTRESTKSYTLFENMAAVAARQWLTSRKDKIDPLNYFSFIDKYIDLLERPRVSIAQSDEPMAGNFSASSEDITLVGGSILFAKCENYVGKLMPSYIDLNDCLEIDDDGILRWSTDGGAFGPRYEFQLVENGKVLEDKHFHRQRIRLDEQISNQGGKLVFLNPNNDSSEVTDIDNMAAPLTFSARVSRAEKWALKNSNVTMLDSYALIRIAQTVLTRDNDMAIEYYNRAESDLNDPSKYIGLSAAYDGKQDTSKALEMLQEAITILKANLPDRMKEQPEETKDPEVERLASCLNEAAEFHISLNNKSAAIELIKEALIYDPSDVKAHWQLITLLCQLGHHDRAEQHFIEWETLSANTEPTSPEAWIRVCAVGINFYRRIWPVVNASKTTSLCDQILKSLQDAVGVVEERQQEYPLAKILYAQGLVYTCKDAEGGLDSACQCWIEALRISNDIEYPNQEVMYWSSKLAAMHYFDQAKEQIRFPPGVATNDTKNLLDDLTNSIDKLMIPFHQSYRENNRPSCYVAAFARLTGQLDLAKDMLRSVMTDALDILSDDDVGNDGTGFVVLFETLLRYGDIEGAFSAYSLLDRAITRGLSQHSPSAGQREVTDAVSEDEHNSANTNGIEDNVDEEEGAQKEEQNKEQKEEDSDTSSDGSDSSRGFDARMLAADCNYCFRELCSDELDEEKWWCKYCPAVTFCAGCKDKHLRGERTRYVCNPKHDLVLINHFKYSQEELEGNNVLIDFKLKEIQVKDPDSADGAMIMKRERVGGRIVDLSEWVKILREEWNIKETKLEGTLQQ